MTAVAGSGRAQTADATSATMRRLAEAALIAVIRAPDVETAIRAVDALVRGGVSAIEITYSTPDVPSVLRRLADAHGDQVVLGVGTVTRPGEVRAAVDARAEFLVSPGMNDEVATAMTSSGLASMIGAFTPTEVMRAQAAGAHAVKLFPASTGGVEHLRALRGPFPRVRLVPTGGVSAGNVREWLSAGAFAVGAAGSLCPPAAMAAGDFAEIERRAAAFSAAVREHRAADMDGTGES